MALRAALIDALPVRIRDLARRVRGRVRLARVQRPMTAVLGPEFRRSRRLIEIDITWACNLRCYNCNRSCEQAPTGEGMSLEQVSRFVDESLERGVHWDRIRVLGGEPTLHPRFLDILEELLRYRALGAPGVRIEVVTNGHGPRVRAALRALPPGIEVENTAKGSPTQPFETFNVAPVDRPAYRNADFTNGCWVTQGCGIGLTPYGYYPCAVAGGIDRILGLDLGRKQLPSSEDDLADQLEAFCRMCGSFKREVEAPVHAPVASPSWTEAYRRHAEGTVEPPTRY